MDDARKEQLTLAGRRATANAAAEIVVPSCPAGALLRGAIYGRGLEPWPTMQSNRIKSFEQETVENGKVAKGLDLMILERCDGKHCRKELQFPEFA